MDPPHSVCSLRGRDINLSTFPSIFSFSSSILTIQSCPPRRASYPPPLYTYSYLRRSTLYITSDFALVGLSSIVLSCTYILASFTPEVAFRWELPICLLTRCQSPPRLLMHCSRIPMYFELLVHCWSPSHLLAVLAPPLKLTSARPFCTVPLRAR